MADIIIDADGIERRNGTLLPEPGYVCEFPPTVGAPGFPNWSDAEIAEVIADPNRRKPDIIYRASEGYILDQGSTSACAGYATAGALMRARVARGLPKIIMSGSFVYANSKPNGQDNGSTLDANMQTIVKYGSCRTELCGQSSIQKSQLTNAAYADASMHKGLAVYHCPDKRAFRTGVAAGYNCNVVVSAGSKFSKFTKLNVDRPCNLRAGVDSGNGNHSVLCVDMIDYQGEELFCIVNSWKASWGAGGMAWVSWDSFATPFNYHPFFFVTSSAESDVPLGASA